MQSEVGEAKMSFDSPAYVPIDQPLSLENEDVIIEESDFMERDDSKLTALEATHFVIESLSKIWSISFQVEAIFQRRIESNKS